MVAEGKGLVKKRNLKAARKTVNGIKNGELTVGQTIRITLVPTTRDQHGDALQTGRVNTAEWK